MKAGSAAVQGITAKSAAAKVSLREHRLVRLGVVGTGNCRRSLLGTMLRMKGHASPALSDIHPDNLAAAPRRSLASRASVPLHFASGL